MTLVISLSFASTGSNAVASLQVGPSAVPRLTRGTSPSFLIHCMETLAAHHARGCSWQCADGMGHTCPHFAEYRAECGGTAAHPIRRDR